MKIVLSILSLFVFSFTAISQQATNWKVLTNMSTVKDIAVMESGVWAATTGGVYYNNFSDNTFQSFTRSEGIVGISLTAIAIDKYGRIWMGSSTGTIDIYDPSASSIRTILDIYNSDKTNKQINDIIASGDSMIVSTDYGVSIIDINSYLFIDTYLKFGNLTSNIKVNSVYKDALVYACLDSGIAVQKPGTTNLSAPESWNTYSRSNGFRSGRIIKATIFQNNLIAASESGLYIFNGTNWTSLIPEFADSVADIVNTGESLYFATEHTIYKYNSGIFSTLLQSDSSIAKLALSSASVLYAATKNGVYRIHEDGSTENINPNGPIVNQFPKLSVDKNGVLWSASGSDKTGKGFYKYENGVWTNYNTSTVPLFTDNNYFNIYSTSDNATYAGNWGSGFARIRNGNIDVFSARAIGMNTPTGGDNYLIISSFAADSKGNLWILSYWPADRRPLGMLSPDSIWYRFSSTAEPLVYQQHFNLVIDQYNTKWYSVSDAGKAGLYYFNENNTLDNENDDRAGYRTTSSGLNSNIISSLIVDRRGDIWVGTSGGVNIVSNTNAVLSQNNPDFRISNVFALRQQSINCMVVDPLNQKWIGTNQGLLLVNSDGSSLLRSFNTTNSPLLTDIIKSIAIDEKNGIVYVGTDLGITSFQTTSMMPQETFTELFIYPSPFKPGSGNDVLTIDGLIRDSDIKILTTNGKLINEFSSPGGFRATWDGRDLEGNLVNSGIYFIVAFDKEGNNVTTGKVAILR